MIQPPSDGLAGLICEIESRLTGNAPGPLLRSRLSDAIPDADTYVLIVFDGLGIAQLEHEKAAAFRGALEGMLQSPFPTTTSVAMSTIATGSDPAGHRLVSHLMWLEDLDRVVNTLKWVDLSGHQVPYEYATVLPRPNLWERLRAGDIEPITVQPGPFAGSPLSRLLYRGARFEPAWDDRDLIEATLTLAAEPRRLVFTYFWQVDFAGHVHGLGSEEFSEAMANAASVWAELSSKLPPGAALIGTADHGLIEYSDANKLIVREPWFDSLRFAGDSRGVHIWGAADLIDDFASLTGGTVVEPASLYDGLVSSRLGDRVVLAPSGKVILPPGFDKRLRCYHGGLDPAEVEIPLLVG